MQCLCIGNLHLVGLSCLVVERGASNPVVRLFAILNLVQFSYIHSVVLLSVLFWKKYQKRGSRVRHSVLPLFTNCISISCCNILQSVHTSPLAACRNAWGGKNSLRSNIMPPVSKHCSAAHSASQRCPSALGGELPLAIKIHWYVSRTLTRTMLIF